MSELGQKLENLKNGLLKERKTLEDANKHIDIEIDELMTDMEMSNFLEKNKIRILHK